MFDVTKVRKDFPILDRTVHGRPLIYLDNAATTQIPSSVLDRIIEHYRNSNANVHRGAHFLSSSATEAYEEARESVARFISASDSRSVVFTSGTTAAINMVALGISASIRPGDEIIVSQLEHNSNFLPWRNLCTQRNAHLRILPHHNGEVFLEEFAALINDKTRFVALTHVSNLTGTVLPIKEMITYAHSRNVPVLIDGAQAMRHEEVNVEDLDCDFYCFSGHKMLAPAGIGVLAIHSAWLEKLQPPFFGGGMVDAVSREDFTLSSAPHRFEAGTPNCAGAVGLAAAIDYIIKTGRDEIVACEHSLVNYTLEKLAAVEGVNILGSPAQRAGVVSFSIDGVHTYDLASLLDKHGVAVRSGNHCAHLGLSGFPEERVVRVSPAFYNTHNEIDAFADAIVHSLSFLKKWK